MNSDETASVKKITKTWIIIYEKLPNAEERQNNIIQKIGTYSYTVYIIFFSLFSGISRRVYWTERKTSKKDSRILDKTQHYSMFYLHSTMAKCCME